MIASALIFVLANVSTADEQQENIWRQAQESNLKQSVGWLSLCGLDWLKLGSQTIGSAKENAVHLPSGVGEAKVGTLVYANDQVSLILEPLVMATVDGERFNGGVLDKSVKIGSVTFAVIKRGKRVGIRSWDAESPTLKSFTGLKWFPIDASLKVDAKFVAYKPKKQISIMNVIGDTTPVMSPGYVEFKLGGKLYQLDAQDSHSGLFLNFSDGTSGKETYGAGRFLETDLPRNGHVVIDFNRATNPPCAYTDFATCPLPPSRNHLSVAIKAGEKKFRELKS